MWGTSLSAVWDKQKSFNLFRGITLLAMKDLYGRVFCYMVAFIPSLCLAFLFLLIRRLCNCYFNQKGFIVTQLRYEEKESILWWHPSTNIEQMNLAFVLLIVPQMNAECINRNGNTLFMQEKDKLYQTYATVFSALCSICYHSFSDTSVWTHFSIDLSRFYQVQQMDNSLSLCFLITLVVFVTYLLYIQHTHLAAKPLIIHMRR